MRHGRSVPNEKRFIVSDPRNGVLPEYGLVEEGVRQARESSERSGLGPDTVVISSGFSRAKQTAEILAETIGADEPAIDERIYERGFGDMELGAASLYRRVWRRDAWSATHTYRGVESLRAIAERELRLVAELERKMAGKVIVLVGHADPLNVLKAVLFGESVRSHRKAFSIANAEMQPLATARKS